MKIAVTSQNRKTITGHAGKCRKFWIYDVVGHTVIARSLLELPLEQSFHESHGQPHPLDDANVLICGGMGQGLVQRLKAKGIEGLVTTETDPDCAVDAYLKGTLPLGAPEAHDYGHDHHHDHHHHHAGPVAVGFANITSNSKR